ncbi:unnamed protein product [Rhizoctonia solani]|uniref:Uncharacterized protein n=1 Tax=Rhizoctonia solani TaxID=456999 RepID=A0A8H3DRD3_9AGAM|nr:unnamed protein product [Rhizoctonia solani]
MASEESFTHVGPPSSIGHGSTQNARPSNSRALNRQGTTYVRVGRGIVPVERYENNKPRSRTASGLVTQSVYGTEGETSPGGTPKQKWYKQPFIRGRYLSLQGVLSGRNPSATNLNKIPAAPREEELPVINIAPARVTQNEAGPSKLRKPQSRSHLPPTPISPAQHDNQRNIATTPPPLRSVRSMYTQPPSAQDGTDEDQDGQLLLDLLGVRECPPTSPPANEQPRPHRLPTPEPEPESDQGPAPTPIRRLPPVPVLNIVPPHDSQDAFAYVFGPNQRSSFMEHKGLTAPPPYVARQSVILDHVRSTRGQPPPPDQKREVALPPVAPLSIRRKNRNQGETGR